MSAPLESIRAEGDELRSRLGKCDNVAMLEASSQIGRMLAPSVGAKVTASNKLTAGSDVTDFYKGLGTGAPGNAVAKVVDLNRQKNDVARAQQQIAMLGQLASVDDQVKAKELELSAAYLATGVSVGKSRDAVLNLVRAQAEIQRVSEQAGIGVFSLRDASKAAGDQFQSWIDRKLLDPSNLEQMTAAANASAKAFEDLSDQAKVAGAALPQLQAAFNDATSARKQLDSLAVESMSINRNFFVEFGQNLRNGSNAWDSFKTAGLNALGKLADKLMGMAADNLFSKAFGGSSSGGGLFGLLGGLFGVGSSGGGAMSFGGDLGAGTGGMAFPKFASGTNSAPGGLALVGENGPELVNLPKGAQVFNNGQTRGMMGGGSGSSPNVTIVQNNDFSNADPGSEARMRQYTDQSRKMAVNEAVQAVRTVQNQNPAYLRGGR